ncbi:hypothetical protein FACS1894159_01020 [Bacteroidia bacterium]|nr:hypothetical protein FACS1894159_01020 [Bacteroidia bacterium]
MACTFVLAGCSSGNKLDTGDAGEPWKDFAQKDAFKRVYPQYFAFRGEMSNPLHASYEAWSDYFYETSGFIRKLVYDEVSIKEPSREWANRYAQEHPEKLLMMHLNGEARRIDDHEDVLERYFPGHWIHLNGCAVADDLSQTDATIKLSATGNINNIFSATGYNVNDDLKLPHQIVIVRTDESGEKLWYESEYAEIVGVNNSAKTITVVRGLHNTTPLSYTGGKACVAPLSAAFWETKMMWHYNMSSACPRDRDGKQAWQLVADEIAGWFKPEGILHNVQGIAFDVNNFDVSSRGRWDVDNDGVADQGWIDGNNVWREGDWNFFTRLRDHMGPNFILTGDAQHSSNQQAVGIMNGMESEGLVQWNDMWRGFSRAVNTHIYWKDINNTPYDYRYVVLKLNGPDELRPMQMRRFGAAMACTLEAFVTSDGNRDFIPAAFRASGSLGYVNGAIVREVKLHPELVNKPVTALLPQMEGVNCAVSALNGKLAVRPNPGIVDHDMRFRIKNIDLPGGDITFFMSARATDPLEGFSTNDLVPRIIWLKIPDLPDYGEGNSRNSLFTELYGMTGTHRTEEMSYFFRRVPAGVQDIEVTIQGLGEMEISSFSMYNAPDVVARRFDNGVIVSNPAEHSVTVGVASLFPGVAGLPGSVEIPGIDAMFFKLK